MLARYREQFLSPLYSNAYALICSNLLNSLAGYLFWLIVARRFGAYAVGVGSAVLSAMLLLGMITDLGLGAGLIRYLSISESGEISSRLIQSSLSIRFVISLAAGIVFLVGLDIWAPGLLSLHYQSILLILFVLITVLNGLYLLQNSIFIALQMAHYVLLVSIIFNSIKVLAVLFGPSSKGVETIIGGTGVALLFASLVGFTRFVPKLIPGIQYRLTARVNGIGDFLKYAGLNQISNLLISGPLLILPIMVVNTLGATKNAHFYIAWMTANIFRTASMSIAHSAFADASVNIDHLQNNLQRSFKLTALLILGIGLPFTLLATKILGLYGIDFSEQGAVLLPWFVLSIIPFSYVNLYLIEQRVNKRTKPLLTISTALALSSLAGVSLGMKIAGLQGLAIGWALSQLGVSFLTAILQYLKPHKDSRNIRNIMRNNSVQDF